jgi:hypothetical protein
MTHGHARGYFPLRPERSQIFCFSLAVLKAGIFYLVLFGHDVHHVGGKH